MADNPLLPQDRVRDLHALMLQARKYDRGGPAREALVAATLIHLSAGDLVSPPPGDKALPALSPKSPGGDAAHHLPSNLRIPLCSGAARGMQTAGGDRLTIAFAEAGQAASGWADALRWAQQDELPLLFVVADTGTSRPRAVAGRETPLLWPNLVKLAGKIHLPYFPVDGDDAVAVYRVVQETSARARTHGGPSVIWAMLSPQRPSPSRRPLRRLEAYMATRDIRPRP